VVKEDIDSFRAGKSIGILKEHYTRSLLLFPTFRSLCRCTLLAQSALALRHLNLVEKLLLVCICVRIHKLLHKEKSFVQTCLVKALNTMIIIKGLRQIWGRELLRDLIWSKEPQTCEKDGEEMKYLYTRKVCFVQRSCFILLKHLSCFQHACIYFLCRFEICSNCEKHVRTCIWALIHIYVNEMILSKS